MKNWKFNPLLDLFNPFNYFNELTIFMCIGIRIAKVVEMIQVQ